MKRILLALLMVAAEAKAENFFVRIMPPKEQGQLRKDMPYTVGMPLSGPFNMPGQGQYRWAENLLIGASLYTVKQAKDPMTYGSGYRYESKSQISSLYVEYYLSGTSGFHIGCGVEGRTGSFIETYRDRNGAEEESARGNYKAIYGGPSFGWTWIWTNGVTFGFDISTRKQMQSEITSRSSANAASDTMQQVEKKAIPDIVPGTLMLGYSF